MLARRIGACTRAAAAARAPKSRGLLAARHGSCSLHVTSYVHRNAAADERSREQHADAREAGDASGAGQDPKERILERALGLVQRMGWTTEALAAAASELGYSHMAHGLFPRGGGDLILFFVRKCNRELSRQLQHRDLQSLKVRDRIKTAVRIRLEMMSPLISSWPQAMATLALPQNAPDAAQELAFLVDDMWHYAGDSAVDINWYTKRGLLAGVYTATELYMLTDYSLNFEDTWRFLDRRVDDVILVGRTLNQASAGSADFLGSALRSLGSLFAR